MAWATVSWAYKDVITSAKLAQMVENLRVHDHVSTDQGAPFTWTAYTPTWTATTNPAIGNGTLAGRWLRLGKLAVVEFSLAIGSTTTLGSGSWSFALPAAVSAAIVPSPQSLGGYLRVARGGAVALARAIVSASGSSFQLQTVSASFTATAIGTTTGFYDAATPSAWASADTIMGYLLYETA